MTRVRSAFLGFGARETTLLVACVIAFAVFALASPYFATSDNLLTILRNSNELLFLSLGMTLLLAMADVDVSVGMTMGLAAISVGYALQGGWPPLAAGLLGPLTGAVLGLVTASVVVLGRIPAIVGTLGLLGVYRAAIFLALGGSWLSGIPDRLTKVLDARPLGIPVAIIVVLIVYGCVWLVLRRTPFGPHLLAIGNSEERARLSGVAVKRTRFATFVVNGILCGIAATALGGTSLTGGRCSLLGTAIGVLLLRLLQNGLLLMGVPSLWQTVVTGGLLLGVLAFEVLSGRISLERFNIFARVAP